MKKRGRRKAKQENSRAVERSRRDRNEQESKGEAAGRREELFVCRGGRRVLGRALSPYANLILAPSHAACEAIIHKDGRAVRNPLAYSCGDCRSLKRLKGKG